MNSKFAKTKILATLGPAVSTKEKLAELVDAGIDGVRFNFSHSDYDLNEKMFRAVEEVSKEKNVPIATLLDLGGPKIRTGEMSVPEIPIISGETIEITTEDVIGTKDLISTSYKELPKDANIGDKVLIDDGLIHLKIIDKKAKSVICKIETGGILKRRKGMNLPGMTLSTPCITEKDYKDLEFSKKLKVDYIALSFVRAASDIIELREWLNLNNNTDIKIIAKIEKEEAVENFDEILKETDGIMVARGDLGVEVAPQAVPIIQKQIIRKCNEVGKLVITATQMLDSMINNPMPTRAEASDVANAVLDGTEVVMLSGETAMGVNPPHVVKTMNDILLRTEEHYNLKKKIKYENPESLDDQILNAVGSGIVRTADQTGAAAIVAITYSGPKALMLTKFRPHCPVFAVTNNPRTLTSLNLRWGIRPIFESHFMDEDSIVVDVKEYLKQNKFAKSGDLVIFTAGIPYTDLKKENKLRFEILD